MKKYLDYHEKYVIREISENRITVGLSERHRRRIEWLQHERISHLITTIIVIFSFLISCVIIIASNTILSFLLWLILIIMTLAYIFHYYFLENTVQRWYKIADEIDNKIEAEDLQR